MKRVEVLVAALAVILSGCVIGNKPQPAVAAAPAPPKPVVVTPAPAPPPPPLSDPQTRVELPPPQPLSTEAVATTIPPEESPAKPPSAKPSPRGGSRGGTPTSARAEPVGPTVPTPPSAAPPAAESERPMIGEILAPSELTRLQAETAKIRTEIAGKLRPFGRRHLSAKDQELKDQATSYVKSSEDAERQGDIRLANEYAHRGLVVARALADGR